MVSFGVEVALAAIILWSFSTTLNRYVSEIVGSIKTGLLIAGFGLIPIMAYAVYAPAVITLWELGLALLAGAAWAIAGLLFYKALETEQVSNAIGAQPIQPVLILLFSVLILGELLTTADIAGGIMIVIGASLVASKAGGIKFNLKLIPAFMGQAIWAFYWILLSLAILSAGNSAVPLMVARITSFAVFILFYKMFYGSKAPRKRNFRTMAPHRVLGGSIAGIADGIGNVLYSNLVLIAALAQGSIIFAMSPLIVVAFSHLGLGERLTRNQAIGILIAVGGAAIMAIA